MKRFLLSLATVALLSSCSSDGPVKEPGGSDPGTPTPPPTSEPAEYTVNFKLTGELTLGPDEPLFKSDQPDVYYYVQVYSRKAGTQDDYTPCASGSFDSFESMVLKATEGQQYKYTVGVIKDLYSSEEYIPYGAYAAGIFQQNTPVYWSELGISNQFFWTSLEKALSYGGIAYKEPGIDFPFIVTERGFYTYFYGTYSDYTPTADGTVTIQTKAPVTAVRFIVNDLTSGNLSIEMEGSLPITVEATGAQQTIERTLTYGNRATPHDPMAWIDDNYSEDVEIVVYWEDNGAKIELSRNTVQLNRKKIRSMTINVDLDGTPSIGLNMEEDDLSEDPSVTLTPGN